jgi:hypothetical protein
MGIAMNPGDIGSIYGTVFQESMNQETFELDGQQCVTPEGLPLRDWRIVLEYNWKDIYGMHPIPIPTFGVC